MSSLAALLLSGALAASPLAESETAAAGQRRAAFEHCRSVLRAVEPITDAGAELQPAELQRRLREPLRAAAQLASTRVDGLPLVLPWVEQSARELEEVRQGEEGARLAGRLYDQLFETCRRLGLGDFPETQADKRRLLAILSRPEYDLRDREEFVLFRILESLRTWLRDVFALSSGVETAVLSFRALFLVGTCLLAAWLALRAGRAALRRRSRRAGESEAIPPLLDAPQAYESRAERALSEAQGREAIRLALLALLATLERLRLAAPGGATTNREVAEQIAARGGSPELSREALAAIEWYDRTWYGLDAVSPEQARGFFATVQALRRRAGSEARFGQEAA